MTTPSSSNLHALALALLVLGVLDALLELVLDGLRPPQPQYIWDAADEDPQRQRLGYAGGTGVASAAAP